MIWAITNLILSSIVLVGVIRLVRDKRKLQATIKQLERDIEEERSDRKFWSDRYVKANKALGITLDGLTAVRNLRTDKMANIGQRMYQVADTYYAKAMYP